MRLTIKLVLWFIACVVLAVGINSYFAVRSELERFEADIAQRHEEMGRVLRLAFAEVMDTDGEARALSVLAYTDKRMRRVDIRWVHLEENVPPERQPLAPRDELAALFVDRDVHYKDVRPESGAADGNTSGKIRSYIPVHIEGRSLSALEFSEGLHGEKAVIRHAIVREARAVVAIVLSTAIAAVVLGMLLVGRPIRRLVAHARRVGRGDLSPMDLPAGDISGPKSSKKTSDEIDELTFEMNAMTTRLAEAQSSKLKALDQLRHAERLSTVGKLASGLAHELGTPLNVITLRAKAIAQGRAAGTKAEQAATTIAEQATRMTNLVRQLLDFARRRTPQRAVVDLDRVLHRSVDLIDAVAKKAKVEFEIANTEAEPARIRGDSVQLEQVFMNLFMNAIQAMNGRAGVVHITIERVIATPPPSFFSGFSGVAEDAATSKNGKPSPKADLIRVSVRDEGTGIADEAMEHLFEPFFTTKDIGEGTGLGLAVCYGIVRDHGGWIDVTSRAGSGSTFAVHLPHESATSRDVSDEAPALEPASEPSVGTEVIVG